MTCFEGTKLPRTTSLDGTKNTKSLLPNLLNRPPPLAVAVAMATMATMVQAMTVTTTSLPLWWMIS